MGAESSSLQAIESLNSTLDGIEKKLGVIEDVHLHHERTICHDNVAIVSGKQIRCYPDVQLTVGPVVGLISQSSVRILVETDADVTLTFHFFLFDQLHTESRFFSQSSLECKAHLPNAKTFDGLMADMKYVIYIGGCRAQCTLLKYATFKTLPRSESSVRPQFLFTHSGRVDRIVPGELDLWQEVQKRVMISDDQTPLDAHGDGHDDNTSSVHMIFHLGNFIDIDNLIRSRVIELLDVLLRDDAKIDGWELLMAETEEMIRDAYRRAYNTPEVKTLLRNCGHIFLAGENEAAMLTSSFLGMAPDAPAPVQEEEKEEDEEEASPKAKKKKKGKDKKEKGAVLGFREAKKRAAAEAEAKAKAEAEKNRAPLKRGEEDPRDRPKDTDVDLQVPAVGGATRRTREAAKGDVGGRSAVLEELRRLLLGAVVRMVRRVSWAYMRQLWDSNFETVAADEAIVESNQRQVLIRRKDLQIKCLLLEKLETSLKKVVKEFGEEYRASMDIRDRVVAVRRETDKAQVSLRDSLDMSAKLSTQVSEAPNGLCVDLGGVLLVLLESAWGWLGRDGLAQTLYNRDIAIHSTISTDIDSCLFEGRGTNTPSGDAVRTVICVSSVALLPVTENQNANLSPDEPQAFTFASVDSGKLFRSIALWQQRAPERATLLSSPCRLYAASGWISPVVQEEEDGDTAKDVEGWNGDRCKLRLVLINKMNKQSKAKGDVRHGANEGAAPREALVDESAGFQVLYDTGTSVTRKSYWEACSYPATEARQTKEGAWIIGKDAGFNIHNITDSRETFEVAVGPVIGRVGPTSATVMLQVARDAHVELLCVDQLTGVEFSSAQLMRMNRPAHFTFDGLTPGRSYDIRLPSSSGAGEAISRIRGSFTTVSADNREAEERENVRKGLRADVHGLHGNPSETPVVLGKDTVETQKIIPVEDASTAAGTAAGSEIKEASSMKALHARGNVALRAFVVGANKPSWLRCLPHQEPEELDESALGADREHLARGLTAMNAVVDVTSRALSPVDLIIHVGYSVDLNVCIDTAVKALSRAEEAATMHPRNSAVMVSKAISEATEILRTAYALHWGGSSTRKLMAHGSHLLVSSPMLDLLVAFNAPTLRQLGRDLSTFASKHLLQILTTLEAEYQTSLWDGGVLLPNADGHSRERYRAHFTNGGSVAIMPMRIRSLFAQDSYGTSEDGLLSEFFFESLASLLGLSDSLGSPVNNQEYLVDTLILVSPLPIIHDDPALVEGTFVTNAVRGLSYSPSETLRLLDLVSRWAEEVAGREVLFVTGGVDIGHRTSIYSQLLDEPEIEESDEISEDKEGNSSDNDAVPVQDADTALSTKASAKVDPTPSPATASAGLAGFGFGGGKGFGMFSSKKQPEPASKPEELPRKASFNHRQSVSSNLGSTVATGNEKAGTQVPSSGGDEPQRAATREPVIVCISQISVGALVGVPGDDMPETQGELFSTHRRFSYVHEYFERDAQCGYIEVKDNRFVKSEDGYLSSTAEVLDHRTLVDIQDAVDGKAIIPDTDITLNLNVLKDDVVRELWRHSSAHLKGSRKKKSEVPQDNNAIALSDMINNSLDAEETVLAYPDMHKSIIQRGMLAIPLRGGWAVEELLIAASRFLLHRMPSHYREVCPVPSSLVVRLVWTKLIASEERLQNKLVKKSEAEGGLPDAREMVTAAIVADAGYLAFIVRQCIEAQALLEHFAAMQGIE